MIVKSVDFRGERLRDNFIKRVELSKVKGDKGLEVEIMGFGKGDIIRVNGIVIRV